MIEMTEYNGSKMTRIVADPRLFEKADKETARQRGLEYVCRCMPDKDLRYKFSKDLKLYPTRNTTASEHAPYCVFSDQYEKNQQAKKTVIPRNIETGELKAAVFEDITKPLSRSSESNSQTSTLHSEEEGEGKGRTRMLRLIKDLNLEVSQRQAQAFNRKIRNIYDYNRWVFQRAKETPIEGRGIMMNDPDSGIKFVYEIFIDAAATVKNTDGESKEYILSEMNYDAAAFCNVIKGNGYKCYIQTTYKGKAGEDVVRKIYCTLPALTSGLKTFIRECGSEDRAYLHAENGYIIATGYDYEMAYKDRSGGTHQTRKIGRLWFFITSSYGTYVKDSSGADMANTLFMLIYGMEDVRCYITDADEPCAIVTADGCPVKLVVGYGKERRGMINGGDLSLVYDPADRERFKEELFNNRYRTIYQTNHMRQSP